MSTPRSYWLSSFPFTGTGRSPQLPHSSDSSDTSPTALPNPFTPLSDSTEKSGIWGVEAHDAMQERNIFSVLRSHPLFDRGVPENSPPPSPPTSDTLSDDDDPESFVALHHPHPTSHTTLVGVPLYFALEDHERSVDAKKAESPKGNDKKSSPAPSLVPTIIVSRSPSPGPHPCVAEAEALGIKVRDFAHEEHGVSLARPVPDIETLKARYQLYRSADLTPPPDVVDTLRDYDEAWLTEKKQFFDDRKRARASKPTSTSKPWRRQVGKPWCGSQGEEPDAMDRGTSTEPCTTRDSIVDITADSMSLTAKLDMD